MVACKSKQETPKHMELDLINQNHPVKLFIWQIDTFGIYVVYVI